MKNVISKIPSRIAVKYEEGKLIYTSYGLVLNGQARTRSTDEFLINRRLRPEVFYAEVDNNGNTLVLNYVEVLSTESEIVFNGVEAARYTYNPEYKELSIEFEDIARLYNQQNENEINQTRIQILENLVNPEVFWEYMSNLIKNEKYYSKLYEMEMMYYEATIMFSLYLSKVNKAFDLLIENDMVHEIKYLLSNGVCYDRFGYEINAKTIRLAKNLTSVYMSGIIISARLLTKFNINEIENLMKVADYFSFSNAQLWNIILELDVNLTEFSNYLIKSLFINNNMDYDAGHHRTCSTKIIEAVTNFAQLYKDYLSMKEITDPMYPENLKEAHDLASDSYERRRKERIEQERFEAFKNNVSSYRKFCYEVDEYKFIVPEIPDDLIVEGRRMGHCVGGYVSNVINGTSQIMFVRKEDEPYITIEIRNDYVVQAKKRRNELPNEDDDKLIREWAELNGLSVRSY